MAPAHKLPVWLQRLVDPVTSSEAFGMNSPCLLELRRQGSEPISPSQDVVYCDRFKMTIPYAEREIVWDLIFDQDNPNAFPDFIFHDDFEPETLISADDKWTLDDECILEKILLHLIESYKQFQLDQCRERPSLRDELTSFEQLKGVLDSLDVLVLPNGDVFMAIELAVQDKPPELSNYDAESWRAVLKVKFERFGDAGLADADLIFGRSLERFIDARRNFKLELPSSTEALVHYCTGVEQALEEMIEEQICLYKSRQVIMTGWARELRERGSLLEFDDEGFEKLSALVEHNGLVYTMTFRVKCDREKITCNADFRSTLHLDQLNRVVERTYGWILRDTGIDEQAFASNATANIQKYVVDFARFADLQKGL